MGFRNLSAFNKALLAKQVWRIIQNLDSLVARILKARYFRHSDILAAPLGRKPSFIWRSMVCSRDIITKASVWKIGRGNKIDIFRDVWLPSRRKCFSFVHHSFPSVCKVEDLLLEGNWNESLVSSLFPHFIAKEILQIPLPGSDKEDERYWCFDEKGKYSVREGYKVEMGFYNSQVNQSEGLAHCDELKQTPVQIFSDSLLAVQAVTDTNKSSGYTRSWANDIRVALSEASATTRQLYHMRRSANIVAHAIASFASFSSSPLLWKVDAFPSCLKDLVCNDTLLST
ncbi:Ribonuclease H-like superfamily protein [Striga hermonthica]|uniref:Ribonuclease H-like superfamily protein n=1 Tax=Striga hermonthica TaxID=68872 RepID=A0A9N7MVV2_STRHE|nr:Ribonuclease H-like superfamily protein [Striga hermonthica]